MAQTMTLEDFYFISQIVAAVGIMLSLIFVGLQIKQNTSHSKAEAAEAAHRAMIDWYYHQTPQTAAIMAKASQSGVELTDSERYQYFSLTMPLLMNFQEAYLKWMAGSLEESRWLYWDSFITIVLQSSAADEIWDQRKTHFTPDFQEYIQTKMNQREGPLRGTWQKPFRPSEQQVVEGDAP